MSKVGSQGLVFSSSSNQMGVHCQKGIKPFHLAVLSQQQQQNPLHWPLRTGVRNPGYKLFHCRCGYPFRSEVSTCDPATMSFNLFYIFLLQHTWIEWINYFLSMWSSSTAPCYWRNYLIQVWWRRGGADTHGLSVILTWFHIFCSMLSDRTVRLCSNQLWRIDSFTVQLHSSPS